MSLSNYKENYRIINVVVVFVLFLVFFFDDQSFLYQFIPQNIRCTSQVLVAFMCWGNSGGEKVTEYNGRYSDVIWGRQFL